MRRLAVACAFVIPFALAQLVAYAQSYTDTITGIELPNSTSTTGNFAGRANGQLPGSWYASVNHTALSNTVGGASAITGGTFTLAATVNGEPVLVAGTFTGGTVAFLGQAPGCGNQYYAVGGALAVSSALLGAGPGSFSAKLVHYRAFVFGACRTYFASVAGTVGLY